MDMEQLTRAGGWATGLAAAVGHQVWWWTGGGPAWLPVLTGPGLVAATLGFNQAARRRSDPEFAARKALAREAAGDGVFGSGGLVGARQS